MSGRDLAPFFRQWLDRPGLPDLSVGWRWDEGARQVVLDAVQRQGGEPYELDLDLAFPVGDAVERRAVTLRRASESARVGLPGAPSAVELDPDGWLLLAAPVVPRPLDP